MPIPSLNILPYFGPSGTGISPAPTATPSPYANGPTFADIMKRLNTPLAGQANFETGVKGLTPSAGFDPAYQKMIDQIRSNASFYGDQGAQAAQALAAKRGLAGSSVEQFGTQEALNNVNRTAADQEAQVYMADLQRRNALQDAQAKAYLDRAGAEGTLGGQQSIYGANLTSDEIASLRNMALGQQSLELQKQLGQQGIDIANRNIDASKDIAQQNGWFSLGGSLLPGLLFGGKGGGLFGGGGGGGGGFLSGLFGGGGAGAAGATGAGPGGIPLASAANGPLAAYGGLGGIGLMGLGGLASMGLNKWETSKLQGKLGTTLGTTAGYFLNPLGSQLNYAKKVLSGGGNTISNVAKDVGNAVTSVFPF